MQLLQQQWMHWASATELNMNMETLPLQSVKSKISFIQIYSLKKTFIFNQNIVLTENYFYWTDEAAGSSIDWVYGRLNVSLTYTYEFRDKGNYGFILPADQIIPNSLEVMDSLQGMVEEAKALGYL